MIAGIFIDRWKLPIFKRHLDTAGFTYTKHPGLTPDTLLLKITCDRVHTVLPIVKNANDACFGAKGNERHD